MPPIKLYKWYFAIIISVLVTTSCSNKTASHKILEKESIEISTTYNPPSIITVVAEKEKTNKDGEIYYDDEYGNRYWKKSDGKFYLDEKYRR